MGCAAVVSPLEVAQGAGWLSWGAEAAWQQQQPVQRQQHFAVTGGGAALGACAPACWRGSCSMGVGWRRGRGQVQP